MEARPDHQPNGVCRKVVCLKPHGVVLGAPDPRTAAFTSTNYYTYILSFVEKLG